ncbi:MAG: hypothetical protein HY710_00020 [Candidatus Latescibacteria bacterium]|nr:hypothetical protein [Candidatus Latescibacterota bacterium]
MTILDAFKAGKAAASGHKRLVALLWLANVLVALTLTIPFHRTFDAYIRNTQDEHEMTAGFRWEWFQRFRYDTPGQVVSTFSPSVIGYAPFLKNLDDLTTGRMFTETLPVIVGMGAVYLLVSVFLAGSIVGALAQTDDTYSTRQAFIWGGTYFGRFIRLAILSLLLYYLLLRWGFGLIRKNLPAWTLDMASETPALVLYLGLNGVTVLVLMFVDLAIDYARIKTVLEDRRSMILATLSAFRFAGAHILKTFGLYLLIGLVGLLCLVVYAVVEALIPQHRLLTIGIVFVIQQLYFLSLFWVKCWFYGGELVLYRGLTAKPSATPAPTPPLQPVGAGVPVTPPLQTRSGEEEAKP